MIHTDRKMEHDALLIRLRALEERVTLLENPPRYAKRDGAATMMRKREHEENVVRLRQLAEDQRPRDTGSVHIDAHTDEIATRIYDGWKESR